MFSNNLSSTVLSSDDLEEIDRFHTAWCEENGVDKTDAEALDVASSLMKSIVHAPSSTMRRLCRNPSGSNHFSCRLRNLHVEDVGGI